MPLFPFYAYPHLLAIPGDFGAKRFGHKPDGHVFCMRIWSIRLFLHLSYPLNLKTIVPCGSQALATALKWGDHSHDASLDNPGGGGPISAFVTSISVHG
jgi:hypothetical protein